MIDETAYRKIFEEITNYSNEYNIGKDKVFEALCPSILLDLDIEESISDEEKHIGELGNDKGIDFVYIDEEEQTIHLFQCKYSETENKIFSLNMIDSDISVAERWLNSSDDTGNRRLLKFKENYYGDNKSFNKVWYCCIFGKANDDLKKFCDNNKIQLVDIDDILNEFISFHLKSQPKSIKKIETDKINKKHSWLKITHDKEERIDAYIFKVKIRWLYEIVKRHGYSLFDANLRQRLRQTKKSLAMQVSEDIISTLNEEPEKFVYLNNGLTIACSKIENSGIGNKENVVVTMHNPQIINGCQTSNTIYNWYKNIDRDVNAEIIIKALEIKDKRDIIEVTKAANLQNPIESRDLYSSDELQIKIEYQLQEKYSVFYDRKKGLWDEIEKNKKKVKDFFTDKGKQYKIILNTEAGQWYLAQYGFVSFAANNKKKIFSNQYYDFIYNPYSSKKVLSLFSERDWCGPIHKKNMEESFNSEYNTRDHCSFAKDTIFNMKIQKHAKAINYIYNNTKKKMEQNENELKYLEESTAFIKYWDFMLIRMINYIVYYITSGNREVKDKVIDMVDGDIKLDTYFYKTKDLAEELFNYKNDESNIDLFYTDESRENYILQIWIYECMEILRELNKTWEKRGEEWKKVMLRDNEKQREIMKTLYNNLLKGNYRVNRLKINKIENKIKLNDTMKT